MNLKNAKKKFVFIDDDNLMHLTWQMEAKKFNIELHCYFSVSDFLNDASKFSIDTLIYVDSNLSDNIKGEVESEKIHIMGFENIYLATGYSKEDIEKPSWIKEVVGKRPCFL